jgi:hypothetical protein
LLLLLLLWLLDMKRVMWLGWVEKLAVCWME